MPRQACAGVAVPLFKGALHLNAAIIALVVLSVTVLLISLPLVREIRLDSFAR